jgi:hypothetical protein
LTNADDILGVFDSLSLGVKGSDGRWHETEVIRKFTPLT